MKNEAVQKIINGHLFRKVKNEIDPEEIIMTQSELGELLNEVSSREYMRGRNHGICNGCKKWRTTIQSGDVGTFTFCKDCKKKKGHRSDFL